MKSVKGGNEIYAEWFLLLASRSQDSPAQVTGDKLLAPRLYFEMEFAFCVSAIHSDAMPRCLAAQIVLPLLLKDQQ